ncbi:hypothetical protein, partial [Microcoleus sp. herbarium12]|uniref:hypothetical protein n=1 Tax=Microcoleus sp. herbarium12 TaxID=3055437 RepID=UPI002FD48166
FRPNATPLHIHFDFCKISHILISFSFDSPLVFGSQRESSESSALAFDLLRVYIVSTLQHYGQDCLKYCTLAIGLNKKQLTSNG